MEIVIGIAAVSVGVKYARQRSKEAELTRAGICITCRGSGKEKCTLCYGMGSIAKPGYVNVADMANRTECKRCKGAGSFICRSCSGGGQLKRNVGASQQATAAPPVGRRQQQGSVRLPQAGPTKKAGA
mmetsp:Transcript_59611/g.189687  ORF Transcript_59611/g.189687 Transcript_59611/m.189687 type:complete len:128 (+) Transcript_59611:27-410(+)